MRDVFQFLPVFIVQNALEIAHLPSFLQISQGSVGGMDSKPHDKYLNNYTTVY